MKLFLSFTLLTMLSFACKQADRPISVVSETKKEPDNIFREPHVFQATPAQTIYIGKPIAHDLNNPTVVKAYTNKKPAGNPILTESDNPYETIDKLLLAPKQLNISDSISPLPRAYPKKCLEMRTRDMATQSISYLD